MFKYLMKRHLFNKDGMMYSILFPVVYTLIYIFALSGLLGVTAGEQVFDPVPVAVIIQGNEQEAAVAERVLQNVGTEGEIREEELVKSDIEKQHYITYIMTTEENALAYMEQGLIDAIIHIDNRDYLMNIDIELARKGMTNISNTVLYYVMDALKASNTSVRLLIQERIDHTMPQELPQVIMDFQREMESIDFSQTAERLQKNEQVNSDQVYLYASMAYICTFFMSTGIYITLENTAPFSSTALREDATPTARSYRLLKTLFSWMFIIGAVLLVVIGIYYANGTVTKDKLPETILLMGLGTLVGLSFGAALAAVLQYKERVAQSISIAVPLIFAATTGMMSAELKYLVMEKAPFLNKINPAAIINDGMYYLNYYPTKTQFHHTLTSLCIYAVVLLTITFVLTGRSEYENL